MSKRGIFRGEVYWADLRSVGIEINHPVMICSCWKSNIKADFVNILVCTTKEKAFNVTHFNLDVNKYNLNREHSCILCESIYTIKKAYLKDKVCRLSNLDMIQIDKNIKDQLQLTQDYQYLTGEDILNKFKQENCSIKQEDDLIKLKCECYSLYKAKKYNKSIDKCNQLLEAIKQAKNISKNEYSYYANYVLSMDYMSLDNEYEKSLEYIKISLTLLPKKEGYDQNLSILMWNYAKCLEKLGKTESVEIYGNLSNYYYKHGFMILSLACRFNSCRVENDVESMQYILEELESLDVAHLGRYETNDYKLNVLEQMKTDLKNIAL